MISCRTAEFPYSFQQSTTWHFIKTATFLHQPDQQPIICCLCHKKRNFTQHLRPLCLFFWEYTVRHEQPKMDTTQPFTPSDPHQQAASPPTTQQQELPQHLAQLRAQAAAIHLLQLPPKGTFQDHCCKMSTSFSGPTESFQDNYLAECLKMPKQKTLHHSTPNT